MERFVDIALYSGYALTIICTVLAIVLPLLNAVGNPKSLIKPVAGLALLAVVILIGWAMADNAVYEKANASVSQWVGGMIIAMYVLIFVAVIGILYSEVSKAFK
ncbi:MAG: hypothetical protein AAFO69_07690 [Bacteroidota bacterium]